MGKKSLIKSTTKSKKGAKEKEETTTKNTKKAAPKTAKKKAAKKTATTKKPAAKTAKKAAPKKAAPKKAAPKKTAPAKPKAAPKKTAAPKKVSIKELVFKKFEPLQALPAQIPATKQAVSKVSAPPLFNSADPAEVERLRALLFRKFSMDEIKAAAKEPEPIPEPEPEPEAEPAAPAVESPREPASTAAAAAPPAPAVKPEPESAAYITVEPGEPGVGTEPMSLPVKIAIAAAATIIFLLLAISYNNSSKYYIYPKDKSIEIWKGCFSPKDKEFFIVLHGVQVTEPVQEVYTSQEVFPLIFNYYVDKADTLLEVPGLPDFDGIKGYLHQAENYAVGKEMKTVVSSRLNTIERMILLYKADVALSKDSEESLESAIKLLKEAATLTPSAAQADEIAQKIDAARERLAKLKAEAE
ncbi:MAG: hypothetical protein PVH87_18525 [Desulfobacteraceae bacterium]|jgi:hypothetical protein